MYISIDANTTLNTDYPIAYMEDVLDENGDTLTRIIFGGHQPLPALVTETRREDLVQMIEESQRWQPQFADMPVFPVPTDTPLTQDQLPFEGEDGADYLNRVTEGLR